jgi:hypothetical protein
MIWTYLDLEVRHFFKMYNSDTSNYNNFRPPCPFRTQQWILAPIAISQRTNRQPHLTLKPMLECGTLRGRKPSVAFRPTWANAAPFMCGAQWMRGGAFKARKSVDGETIDQRFPLRTKWRRSKSSGNAKPCDVLLQAGGNPRVTWWGLVVTRARWCIESCYLIARMTMVNG